MELLKPSNQLHPGHPPGRQHDFNRLDVARTILAAAGCERDTPGAPIFANLETNTGSTWGDYVQYLDSQAQYLGTLGEDVTDISHLFGFEIQQADGLSPITQLGASVDASMPTPGSLSLSFSRFFTPSITGRNTMGPLGMGWSDSWQTSLAVQSDGTVIVTEPGGVQRTFDPDSRNVDHYFDQAGDYGVLAPMRAVASRSPSRTGRSPLTTPMARSTTSRTPTATRSPLATRAACSRA